MQSLTVPPPVPLLLDVDAELVLPAAPELVETVELVLVTVELVLLVEVDAPPAPPVLVVEPELPLELALVPCTLVDVDAPPDPRPE